MNQQVIQHGAQHNAQNSARTTVSPRARQENARNSARTTVSPRSGQKNAQISARTTVSPRPRQKKARSSAHEQVFRTDGAAWGKKWRPCLETKGRRGGVAEWREGEKERSAKDLGFTTGKCHGGRSVGVCCKLTGVEGGVFYSKPPPKGFQGWSLKI